MCIELNYKLLERGKVLIGHADLILTLCYLKQDYKKIMTGSSFHSVSVHVVYSSFLVCFVFLLIATFDTMHFKFTGKSFKISELCSSSLNSFHTITWSSFLIWSCAFYDCYGTYETMHKVVSYFHFVWWLVMTNYCYRLAINLDLLSNTVSEVYHQKIGGVIILECMSVLLSSFPIFR
jgi:hypothetical protein